METLRDRYIGSDERCWHCHSKSQIMVMRFANPGFIWRTKQIEVGGLRTRTKRVKYRVQLLAYVWLCANCIIKINNGEMKRLNQYDLGTMNEVKSLSPLIRPCQICRGKSGQDDCINCGGSGWVPWHSINDESTQAAIQEHQSKTPKQPEISQPKEQPKDQNDQPVSIQSRPRRRRMGPPAVRRENR